ncbi:MAG TPA: DUF2784 domain-containing protein [Gemmatimonadales bacterium]|nr:DUF2784 domain-containing protein [Gemmatimonadales bacterium]
MPYRLLADVVVVLHFAFVLFVVAGGLLVLRWRRLARVHLPVAVYGVVIEWIGFICPLTPLEKALRRSAGEAGYAGGFVEHYVLPVLYPTGLTRGVQWVLGALVLVVNVGVYWWLWRTRGRRERSASRESALKGP